MSGTSVKARIFIAAAEGIIKATDCTLLICIFDQHLILNVAVPGRIEQHISSALPCLKCCNAELPLEGGPYVLCKRVKYYTVHVSPACNALEIRNGIMFDFYPGLPQLAFISNTLNVVNLHFLTTRLFPELRYT